MVEADYGISSSTIICVRLFGPLEVSRRASDGSWQIVDRKEWGQGTPPRSVLKRLLSTSNRRMSRLDIQEDLWPDASMELADRYLNNAVMVLRQIMSKRCIETIGPLYAIVGQSQVWTDLDACRIVIREAENRGGTTLEALPLLEEALGYFERGKCLEDEAEKWCHAVRADAERMQRQCRNWLAIRYEKAEKLWQAGEQYRAMAHTTPPDDEALLAWIQMLARHGKRQEALKCYQDSQSFFQEHGYILPSAVTALAAQLEEQNTLILPSSERSPHDRIETQSISQQDGDHMGLSRRNLIQSLAGFTSALVLPGGEPYLELETLERLSHALRAPADLDESTLTRLLATTKERRSAFVQSDGKTWQEIFQEMSGHLHILTTLLERYTLHPQLCTIAGETALLLGDLLFNAGNNTAAERYYQGALEASQGNRVLQTTILGRKALVPIYDHNPGRAIPLIDEAQQTIPATAADHITAFLWAVKAEAYAALGDAAHCFQALHSAEQLLERGRSGEVSLCFQPEITHAVFDLGMFFGYKGSCLLKLNQSEAAQGLLYDQWAVVKERPLIHQQSITLTDLATSFAQQTAIRQAYEHATTALTYIEQTRSVRVFQRVLKLRQSLRPWANTTYVKSLDEQIDFVARDLVKR